MDGIAQAELMDPSEVRECPQCFQVWPLDRFNEKHAECFRCRSKSVGVAWGPAGKAFWHGTTTREYTEKTLTQARANGMDPIPVKSASVPLAGATLKKLETSAQKVTKALDTLS